MKPNKRLPVLIDDGLVDEVLRQLKSVKEADVFVVRCGARSRTRGWRKPPAICGRSADPP